MTQSRDTLNSFVRELIDEGESVLKTAVQRQTSSFTSDWFVDLQQFHKWRTSCRLLLSQLGQFAKPWSENLGSEKSKTNRATVKVMLGALQSISENIVAGRLARFEDIVLAEAFLNLMEQAKYLLDKGYYLAAGVLFRAVLEEKLRLLCDTHGLSPDKERPTISDFNQAMYKATIYDKITFKNVDAMAATGNEAAHNNDRLQAADIARLHSNLLDFLQRN
jgi:hypothetical protein